jgi:hypothetical protein
MFKKRLRWGNLISFNLDELPQSIVADTAVIGLPM